MTEVLSFLRHSLSALNLDAQFEDTELNRAKSAPAAYGRPSAPRSALRSRSGPRVSERQSVRFQDGIPEKVEAKNEIDIGRSSPVPETHGPQLHEFDRLVRQLDAKQKAELRECLVQRKFDKGETIIQSGSHGDSIFFIGFGSCTERGADGRSVELDAGDYFGEREALMTATGADMNIFDTFLNLQPERKVDVDAGEQGCVVYECPGKSFAAVFGASTEAMAMVETRSKNRLNTLTDKTLVYA